MPNPTRRLRAQKGTDEANFGAHLYRVDNSGEIEVPVAAALPLLNRGGFVDVTPDEPAEPPIVGFSLYQNVTDPTAAFSFAGVSYTPNEDGVIEAPNEALTEVESHGFVLYVPPAAAADPS